MPSDNIPFSQSNPSGAQALSASSPPHASQHSNLNDELAEVTDSLIKGFIREAATVTRLNATQFTVAGNVTAFYTAGRIVVFNDAGAAVVAVVSSSSYSAPNTTVTVSVGSVPNPLNTVSLSIQPRGGTLTQTDSIADGAVTKVKIEVVQQHQTGFIIAYGGALAPAGWLLCNGSAVSRTTFADLFAVIGTSFGAGDGTTTFNLPDLRGRVPVGLDATQTEFDVRGETGGAKTHTLSVAEMPVHTHTQNAHTHTQDAHSHGAGSYDVFATTNQYLRAKNLSAAGGGTTYGVWSFAQEDGDAYIIGSSATTTATNQNTTATNQNTGGGEAHNNLQPYQVINYIIKT